MKKYRKGDMSRKLVLFCLITLTAAAVWAAILKTYCAIHSCEVDVSDVLTFVGASFGGELLLLLVKRVFAKPGEKDPEGEMEE